MGRSPYPSGPGEKVIAALHAPAFGALLRQHRLSAGLTQAALAERAGISERAVQHLEQGLGQPQRETMRRLAEVFALTGQEQARFEAAAQPAPHRRADVASPPAPLTHNLPLQLTSFIGREAQVDEMASLLGHTRLLTLVGAGGVGKTRLALEVAARLLPGCPDGAWFVDLAPLADPALVPQAVAVAVGVREEPGCPLPQTLATALVHRRLLLVLDNCEHLVEACAALSDYLLRACPELRILATSRERLAVSGEVARRVPSLGLPEPGVVALHGALARSEAGQLFATRAAAVQRGFALTEANAPAVARICRRLDGIPLALELAAAHVDALPPEPLAARLDEGLRVLVGGSRTAPQRQQTLQATLDWSYGLLSTREQVVLERLAVFAGGCSLEAAEAVCAGDGIDAAEILGTLVRLVDKSLVTAEPAASEAGHYRLLETVRQYGLQRLAQREKDDATRQRHAKFYLALAERAERELWGPDQIAWQTRLEQAWDNLRVASRWLITRGDVWRAQRLGGALGELWPVSYYSNEGSAWMAELLALGTAQSPEAHSPGAMDPSAARAKVLVAFGALEAFHGNPGGARTTLEECVALCRATGQRRILGHALFRLGQVARYGGDAAAAHALASEGAELSRAAGDRLEEALSLLVLAGATADQGDLARAGALADQSLALFTALGSPRGMGLASLILGGVRYWQGDAAAASARLWDVHRYLHASHSPMGEVYALAQLGWLAADRGDTARARELFAESLRIGRAHGGIGGILTALLGCARLAQADDQPERALRLAGAVANRHGGDGVAVPVIRPELLGIDAWLRTSRRAIGRAAAEAAWAEGPRMSLQEAITAALAVAADESAPATSARTPAAADLLTTREREVVRLLARGFSNRRVAAELVIAESTAALHVENILAKLGFASRTQIAAWAVGQGLVAAHVVEAPSSPS